MRTFYFVVVGWELAGLLGGSHFCIAQEWTPTGAPETNWSSVACSADGSKLVAAVFGGLIYTSTNSGSTWVAASAPTNFWWSVASSADGTRLFAGDGLRLIRFGRLRLHMAAHRGGGSEVAEYRLLSRWHKAGRSVHRPGHFD